MSNAENHGQDDVFRDLIPRRVRLWIYAVATALVPIFVMYGVISESEASAWLGVLATLLVVGTNTLAARHVPKK